MALNFGGSAVIKSAEVEDFGENYWYGDTALIDGGAIEIRGGDLPDDVTVSISFSDDDPLDVALGVLEGYSGGADEEKAENLAEALSHLPEEELISSAWIYLKAAHNLRAREAQVAA